MNHYNIDNLNNIVLIPIKHINFDSSMLKMLNRYNIDYKTDNIIQIWSCNLDNERLESILKGMKDGVYLPPIRVEMFKGHPEKMSYVPSFLLKKGIKPRKIKAKDSSYSIINGRHRVIASLINKNTYIPAKIENIL
jgi:hypothetical protein